MTTEDPDELIATLQKRFRERERRDIERLDRVLAYAREATCLTRHLVGYFGEEHPDQRCGHCQSCASPPPVPRDLRARGLARAAWRSAQRRSLTENVRRRRQGTVPEDALARILAYLEGLSGLAAHDRRETPGLQGGAWHRLTVHLCDGPRVLEVDSPERERIDRILKPVLNILLESKKT